MLALQLSYSRGETVYTDPHAASAHFLPLVSIVLYKVWEGAKC